MRAICPKHAGMIGIASCPDCTIESLRQQLATLNESLRITSEGNFKLRQQLAECERERAEYKKLRDYWRDENGELKGLLNDTLTRATDANLKIEGLEYDLTALQAKYDELVKLSVTNIMIGIAPGDDGMGEEVYAKSVADVEREMNRLCQKLDVVEQQRDKLLVIVECAAVEPCISDDECYVCLSCQAREVLAKVGADKTGGE